MRDTARSPHAQISRIQIEHDSDTIRVTLRWTVCPTALKSCLLLLTGCPTHGAELLPLTSFKEKCPWAPSSCCCSAAPLNAPPRAGAARHSGTSGPPAGAPAPHKRPKLTAPKCREPASAPTTAGPVRGRRPTVERPNIITKTSCFASATGRLCASPKTAAQLTTRAPTVSPRRCGCKLR